MYQYKREYSLTIYTWDEAGIKSTSILTDLRVDFNIQVSLIGAVNIASFRIFNCLPKWYDLLTSKRCIVELRAGYNPDGFTVLPLIYTGRVGMVINRRDDVDTYIEFYSSHANKPEVKPTVMTYETVTYTELLTALAQDIVGPLSVVNTENIKNILTQADTKPLIGLTTLTSAQDELSMRCDELNISYGINNGELIFMPNADNELAIMPPQESIPLITTDNGMLGVPSLTYVSLEVKTLLRTDITLSSSYEVYHTGTSLINVGARSYTDVAENYKSNGIWRCMQIIYTGSTYTDEWYSEFTGYNFNVK